MDKIILSNMKFYGYHGVLGQEQKVGQPFIISVDMYVDLKEAGITDDLTKTVNYASVYEEIKRIVEKEQFNLIEALAQAIASTVLSLFGVFKVKVAVDKPFAPVSGGSLAARVEIVRENPQWKPI